MLVRRILFFAAFTLVLAATLTACDSAPVKEKDGTSTEKQQSGVEAPETKDWKLVKSDDGKLSIKFPQDWSVKTAKDLNLGAGKLFAAFGPKDNDYNTNMQVSKETLKGASLDSYISQFEKNTKEDPSTKEMKVIEEGSVQSDLGEAYRKSYSYILEVSGTTYDLKFDVFYLKKGDDYYVIQMVTTDGLYDSMKKIFDASLTTLNIT